MVLYFFLRWCSLVLIGLLIYGQTFHFDFVFDDHLFIVGNPFIKSFNHIPLIWHSFPMTRLVGMYSFAFNYYFGQLQTPGYHIFNFIVHLCATGLVWALAGLIFELDSRFRGNDKKEKTDGTKLTKELPFMIAVLFLVHPGQTQAVTYISQRFESMAAVFYLGTVYCYLYARLATERINQIRWFCFAGLLTMLGLMTKETIITVPVMLLAVEWILFPKKDNRLSIIILAVTGAVLYVLFVNMGQAGVSGLFRLIPSESHDGEMLTPMKYVLTQMRVFLTFLRLLVLPIHQNLDYDYPASSGLLHPPLTFVGLGVISGLIVLIVKLRRRNKLIAFGLAWMLITFSVNLAPRANVIFEHKLYLISFGFLLAFVGALSKIVLSRGTLLRILWCLVAVLAVVSFQRNRVWRNELTLWQEDIKRSPDKARVNASLGRVYGSAGEYDKAVYYLSRAIAIKPDNISYENRGIIYFKQGKDSLALKDLNQSIAMDPNYFSVYVKRSWVFQTQHNYAAALSDLQRAIALEPYYADAHIERGMLWAQLGRYEEALKDFQHALSLDPLNPDVARYKDYCLEKMNKRY